MGKVDKLLSWMADEKADYFVVSRPSNMFYLGLVENYEPPLSCIIISSDGKITGMASSLEANRAMDQFEYEVKIFSPYKYIDSFSRTMSGGVNMIIRDAVTKGDVNVSGTPITASSYIEDLRVNKEPDEINLIREAAKISSKVAEHLHDVIVPGKTEYEASLDINSLIHEYGGRGLAFETIVASGENSSHSHHVPSERKIKNGDVVICDFGARYGGYCSDITRTVFVGSVDDDMNDQGTLLTDLQSGARSRIKNGVKYSVIDDFVRDELNNYDLASKYPHGLGHGVGIDVHEKPTLSSVSTDTAAEGHIFTIEPGVYIRKLGGIRVEDDFILTENGVEKLSFGDVIIR